jgi:plastocyanin
MQDQATLRMGAIVQVRMFKYVIVAIMVAFVFGACSSSGGVKATEKDFDITLGSSSASSGDVTFNVENNGPSTHEFVVFKTDLAEGSLPTKKENGAVIVDEEGTGVTHIDEIEDLAKGDSQDLTVNLKPGKYVVLCNLPTHYQLGMHAAFTVK